MQREDNFEKAINQATYVCKILPMRVTLMYTKEEEEEKKKRCSEEVKSQQLFEI